MANVNNLKPFSKNDDRINRKGRPKELPELKAALTECLTPDELKSIINAIIKKAIKGDIRAAQLILDRTYGKADLTINSNIPIDKITHEIVMIQAGSVPHPDDDDI